MKLPLFNIPSIRKQILSVILSIVVLSGYSQNFSTMGKDFWFGYMQNLGTTTIHVFISADVDAAGTISIPAQAWTQNFNVVAGTTTEIILPTAQAQTIGSGLFPNGVHLTANEDVAVYALNYAANTSDATVVAPVRTLGSQYYVMAYKDYQAPYSDASQFIIVAAYDNTTVEITPSVATLGGNAAGVPFQVTLNQGDVYQVQANGDLTGSLARSFDTGNGCPNFALFAGNICTGVICAYCDHLKEQMFPTSTWGEEYVLPPLLTRNEDRYRVQASVNGTQISVNGGAPINLNAGQFHQFNTGQPSVVTSNNPISVTQISLGSDCDNTSSDPFTINLSPVEQTLKKITFNAFTSAIITNYYLNVVSTTANTNLVQLDGNNIGGQFNPFPSNPNYSFARLNITQGNHTLESDSGIIAYVYGYGNDESYGYSAGANLSDLTALIRYQVGDYTDQDSVVFICPEDTILFAGEGDSSIISWEWFMGDGATYTGDTVLHNYADYGIYEVMVLVERMNMCALDTIRQIMEVTGPRINIIESDSLCLGDQLQLDVSGGDAYVWSTGDSSNSIIVNPVVDTFYWVYAIDSLCPGMPDTVNISVVDLEADFIQSPVCFGDTNMFYDNSIITNDTLSKWHWDFGNGKTDTIQNPSQVYNTAGNYSISLSIESGFGCKDTIVKALQNNPQPLAQIYLDDVCKLSEAQLLDSSTISVGNIVAWNWDFGDSSTSNIQNPVHVYDSAGIYSVELVVSSDSSCTDTASTQIQVFELPEADFSALPVCNGLPTQFVEASSSLDGAISNWTWDFADSNFASGQNQVHVYTDPGLYQVQLNVETVHGCSDSVVREIEVFAKPVADFNANDVCFGDTAFFENQSSIAIGNISNCTYNLGDGSFANICDPENIYPMPNVYTVELIVESDSACFDSISKVVEVFHLPEAGFSFEDHCFNESTIFTDTSAIQQGNISNWTWDFGDNNFSNDSNPVHDYASPGDYDIQLAIESDKNCRDTVLEQITIHPLPVADFEVDPVCFGLSSEFLNLSSISSGNIDFYNWDFSDGNLSTLENPSHDYAAADTYNVSLEVVSNFDCRDTIIKPATVYALPDVAFGFENICLEDTAYFSDSSSVSDGQIDQYQWNISNGIANNTSDFSHVFSDTGTYSVKLVTESNLGCIDSLQSQIKVYPLPEIDFYTYPACFGENDGTIELLISNGLAPYRVEWNDGSDEFNRGEELFAGTYNATVTDANNCLADTSITVTQPPEPVLVSISPDSSEITFGTELELLASGNLDPNLIYEWENTEYIDCNNCVDPMVNPLDFTVYTVEATDTQGCKGKASAEVFVNFDYIFFAPNAFTPNDDDNNDEFKVFARGVKAFELKVFNRWGELLFESQDLEEGWNGYHQGKLMNPDVFVYHAEIEYLNGYEKAHKGSFTLIR